MKIGIAAENRPRERRISLQPSELKGIAASHAVIVEEGVGMGVGILDQEYEENGAKIGSRQEVYACDIVVRIKEPNDDELGLMRPGSIIMSMMHLRCNRELKSTILKRKLIGIPLENLKDPLGYRKVEAVEAAGRIGMEFGFKLWGKDPAACQVKIMGYGNIARGAIRAAARGLAKVEILNRQHFLEMEKHIPGTDILVDAVNRPFRSEVEKEPPFVTREMLKLFKKGSVIVDLVSNPIGHAPVETMQPTFLDKLYYMVDGIYHTSCWGWPGLEPETITRRYSIQVAPILSEIADKGLENVPDYIKKAVVRT